MNTEPLYVVKADGTRELFDVKKLEYSLKKAGASSKAVDDILSRVNTGVAPEITTHEIYKNPFAFLDSEEKQIELKYYCKREINI